MALSAAYHVVWHRGYNAAELEHQSALAESLQRGLEQAQDIARQDAEVSEYYERLRQKTIVKVEEVTREIPANCAQCGIGSNGLRLINEARGHDSPPADAPVQPDGGLPQLPKIETDKLPDLAGHLLLTSHAYSDCAARHHLLVKRVKAREEARK